MRTILIALRALVFATLFLLLGLWVAMRLRSLDRYLGAPLPEWTPLLGILFIVIGASLALNCVTLFIFKDAEPQLLSMLLGNSLPSVHTGSSATPCTLGD